MRMVDLSMLSFNDIEDLNDLLDAYEPAFARAQNRPAPEQS